MPTLRNVVLALLVVVLATLNILFVRGRPEEAAVSKLFPELVLEDAAKIVITAPGGTTVTLERDEASVWTLAERFGHRAYQPAVEDLLRGLASATDSEREATSSSSHAALGVDASSGNQLRVEDLDGRVVASAAQGVPPEGGRGCRLLPAGQDSVYRTATVPRAVPDPSRWFDPDVVPFDVNAVQELELKLSGKGVVEGAVQLVRRENGRFDIRLTQRSLAPALVDPLLKSLERLVARDVVSAPEISAEVVADGWNADEHTFWVTMRSGAAGAGDPGLGSANGRLGIGLAEQLGAPAPPSGSELAWFAKGTEATGDEEGTWFLIPETSAARLRALAGRIVAAADG